MGQGRWISWLFRIARFFRRGWPFRMVRSFRIGQTGRVFLGSVCRGCGWMLVVAVAGSMPGLVAQGQTPASANDDAVSPQDIVAALHQMSDKAGVIFVGRVSEVRRLASANVAAGVVETKFEVEQAVRGCSAGSYVLREWAGLWEGDNQRYRAGQRLLMLLHEPNAAGLSSPVDGMDGAIPIVRGGSTSLGGNGSARVAPPAVDLRWVGTKLLHPVSYASASAAANSASQPAHAAAQGPTMRSLAADSSGSAGPVATSVSDSTGSGSPSGSATLPGQEAPVDVVVGMLASWQKVEHAVR
jgi:hypothetical protein